MPSEYADDIISLAAEDAIMQMKFNCRHESLWWRGISGDFECSVQLNVTLKALAEFYCNFLTNILNARPVLIFSWFRTNYTWWEVITIQASYFELLD